MCFIDDSSDEDSEAVPAYQQWDSTVEQHGGPPFENESDEGSPEQISSINLFPPNKPCRLSDSDQSNSADDELVFKKQSSKFDNITAIEDKTRGTKRQLPESDSDSESNNEQRRLVNFKRLATEVNERPAYDDKAMKMMVI